MLPEAAVSAYYTTNGKKTLAFKRNTIYVKEFDVYITENLFYDHCKYQSVSYDENSQPFVKTAEIWNGPTPWSTKNDEKHNRETEHEYEEEEYADA